MNQIVMSDDHEVDTTELWLQHWRHRAAQFEVLQSEVLRTRAEHDELLQTIVHLRRQVEVSQDTRPPEWFTAFRELEQERERLRTQLARSRQRTRRALRRARAAERQLTELRTSPLGDRLRPRLPQLLARRSRAERGHASSPRTEVPRKKAGHRSAEDSIDTQTSVDELHGPLVEPDRVGPSPEVRATCILVDAREADRDAIARTLCALTDDSDSQRLVVALDGPNFDLARAAGAVVEFCPSVNLVRKKLGQDVAERLVATRWGEVLQTHNPIEIHAVTERGSELRWFNARGAAE